MFNKYSAGIVTSSKYFPNYQKIFQIRRQTKIQQAQKIREALSRLDAKQSYLLTETCKGPVASVMKSLLLTPETRRSANQSVHSAIFHNGKVYESKPRLRPGINAIQKINIEDWLTRKAFSRVHATPIQINTSHIQMSTKYAVAYGFRDILQALIFNLLNRPKKLRPFLGHDYQGQTCSEFAGKCIEGLEVNGLPHHLILPTDLQAWSEKQPGRIDLLTD